MSNDRKQRILEEWGVVPPVRRPLKRTYDIDAAFHTIKESRQRHGHDGDRAHLEEMLRRDDIPPFIRGRMQLAHNRHLMTERREKHELAAKNSAKKAKTG